MNGIEITEEEDEESKTADMTAVIGAVGVEDDEQGEKSEAEDADAAIDFDEGRNRLDPFVAEVASFAETDNAIDVVELANPGDETTGEIVKKIEETPDKVKAGFEELAESVGQGGIVARVEGNGKGGKDDFAGDDCEGRKVGRGDAPDQNE